MEAEREGAALNTHISCTNPSVEGYNRDSATDGPIYLAVAGYFQKASQKLILDC